jgi:ribosome-associated heat shock protein Hsp15
MSLAESSDKLRIDKFLWAIRIFKTLSLATEACKAGKVKLNGTSLKPSAIAKVGEVYHIQKGTEKKIIEVLKLQENRTDATKAQSCYTDLSPVSDVPKLQSVFSVPVLPRGRGTGRPTKRERRDIDKLQQKGG